MIDYMKKAKWGLWNPVTGDYVWKGSGITNKGDMDNFSADLLYGYGFYKAAENILNMGLSVDFMQGKESAEYTYTNFFRCVITSYSIHYTKLYDHRLQYLLCTLEVCDNGIINIINRGTVCFS